MSNLIDRIKIFINSKSPNEILYYLNKNKCGKNLQLDQSDSYKNDIINIIISGYQDYINILELSKRDAEDEIFNWQSGLLNDFSEGNKWKYLPDLYTKLKFYNTQKIEQFFISNGLNKNYLNHFIDFEKLENILYDIISKDILIDLKNLLIIVDYAYNIRIYSDIHSIISSKSPRKNYDGRKQVLDSEIKLRNIIRKMKYKSNKPHTKDEFEELMIPQFENWEQIKLMGIEYELPNVLFDMLSQRKPSSLKYLIKDHLTPLIEIWGKPEIIKIFKPFFYLIFEDKKNGLLTEKGFENEFLNSRNSRYDRSYNKYLNSQIKILCGI